MSILPWQSELWESVLKQEKGNTLPHAFLFSGVEGIGKTQFALELARYLLCEKSSLDQADIIEACGECKQCKLLNSSTHPDFKLIGPEEGSAVLKIDTIRALVEFFNQSSMQGGRKVSILSPADAMNNNAANALLKTLEEPTPNSVIILISHNAGHLLPTIRSRCQVLDFRLPSISESKAWLENEEIMLGGDVVNQDELEALLTLASNAPLRAQKYAQINALEESETMLAELGALLKSECLASKLAERWNDELATLRLSWMILWLEHILKLKMMPNDDSGEQVQKAQGDKMMRYLSLNCDQFQLFSLYKASLEQYRLFLGMSNPNKVLSFESLLHQWMGLMKKK